MKTSDDRDTPAPGSDNSPTISLSPSVQGLVTRLANGVMPASIVALRLYDLHPEYGGGRWPSLGEKGVGSRFTIQIWVDKINALFRPSAVPELHGRLVLVGLAVLEPEFAPYLAEEGFLRNLETEIREPLDSLLLPQAYQRWRSAVSGGAKTPPDKAPSAKISDNVPTHGDHPVDEDDLGREAFARALAHRLDRVRDDEGWPQLFEPLWSPVWLWFLQFRFRQRWLSWRAGRQEPPTPRGHGGFMLHLHGPWGAGKTSLLNFMRRELTASQRRVPWIAVYFNAWQVERIGPPWWSLTCEVYRQASSQLAILGKTHSDAKLRAKAAWYSEMWWRTLTGIGAPALALGLAVLALTVLSRIGEISVDLKAAQEILGNIGSVVAAIGIALTALRYLATGSARGAAALMEITNDPFGPLIRKFEELVCITGHPIAIFIDDLDRCQSEYVVSLLQGIQTLFWRTPVAYVVAADRQWLRAAYEGSYKNYHDYVGAAGLPLGYLFLEKLFQLSANVPRLNNTSAKQYWRKLIGIDAGTRKEVLDEARRRAKARIEKAPTEADILAATREAATSGDEVFAQAMREEAVVQLATKKVEMQTQHTLAPFLFLLEPNPRALKRMVNAYGVRRAVDVLRGGQVDKGVLALWTILEMRWPLLAEYLANHPEKVELFRSEQEPAATDMDKDLMPLYRSRDLRLLIDGTAPGVQARLDAVAIRQCVGSLDGGESEVMA